MSKIKFKYNIKKDVENFLIIAKAKNIKADSLLLKQKRFTRYKEYFNQEDSVLNKSSLEKFIEKYLEENEIDIKRELKNVKKEWGKVELEFLIRTQEIFSTKLPKQKLIAYLTINDVCGYNIKNNYFFLSIGSPYSNLTIMHELWHFFTWHSFGQKLLKDKKISSNEYYILKESLTEVLNIEFKNLLKGRTEKGYLPH